MRILCAEHPNSLPFSKPVLHIICEHLVVVGSPPSVQKRTEVLISIRFTGNMQSRDPQRIPAALAVKGNERHSGSRHSRAKAVLILASGNWEMLPCRSVN